MEWSVLILSILVAYLIGSIPTGYILVKKLKGIDIRTIGSGSTGATNVKRVLGTKFFILVMLLDGLKGLIPLLAIKFTNFFPHVLSNIHAFSILLAIALVIGHSKSAFLKFKGGKSVAISVGVLYGLCWQAALLATLTWILVVTITKYVSVSSITATMFSPAYMWLFDQSKEYIVFASACAIYVLYLHRENIQRLLAGNENKFSLKEK